MEQLDKLLPYHVECQALLEQHQVTDINNCVLIFHDHLLALIFPPLQNTVIHKV
jgi:hypothetical protein